MYNRTVMTENIVAISAFTLMITSFVIIAVFTKTQPEISLQEPPAIQQPNLPSTPQEPPEPEKPKTPNPKFDSYPAQRDISNLGKVLSDIEGHMPAGHIYKDSDKITWGHETTHGINSHLRMKFSRSYNNDNLLGMWIDDIHGHPVFKSFARINGFYVLEDRAVIINEPNTTITAAAKLVPRSLRGGVYNLYMVQQASSWNDTPLYVFDEWTAYGNGAEVRLDLAIENRSETVLFMLEFNVYSICVGWASKTEDEQFKNYLKWNLARSMDLYAKSKEKLGNASKHDSYLATMHTGTDAESFRNFTRAYLGEDWTKEVLGF